MGKDPTDQAGHASHASHAGADDIEVRCPECGTVFHVPLEKAEREMRARCPKGHDVPLAKALG